MTDQEIELFEQLTGIKLLDCQKEVLKIIASKEELHICMVQNQGRTYLKGIAETVNNILGGKIIDK